MKAKAAPCVELNGGSDIIDGTCKGGISSVGNEVDRSKFGELD